MNLRYKDNLQRKDKSVVPEVSFLSEVPLYIEYIFTNGVM